MWLGDGGGKTSLKVVSFVRQKGRWLADWRGREEGDEQATNACCSSVIQSNSIEIESSL